tara:strand:- start:71 stop:862 length:792 start_codon:yes stop_codon:yes gene_type:complete
MKILSWDIGIKNLSYCLLENNTISDWNVINLDNEINIICNGTFKNGNKCKSKGLYLNKDKTIGYCKRHHSTLENKSDFKELKKPKKKKINLLEIGNKLVEKLDERFKNLEIDNVLLENQPSLKNPTMKSIQMIIYSYFLINGYNKNLIKHIQMISASQKNKYCNNYCKLNTHIQKPTTKSSYNNAKKTAILVTDDILKKIYQNEDETTDNDETTENDETSQNDELVKDYELINDINFYEFFKEHKKKDDLADSYLQGIQFLQK